MEDKATKNNNSKLSENLEQMRALYDAAPYPKVLAEARPQGIPLLDHWINAASFSGKLVLHSKSKILIAGCGSGEEAIMLAKHYSQSQIVGIDFSEQSILRAKDLVQKENLSNVAFDVGDLMNDLWIEKYHSFDFVLCHGVADYVADVSKLMKNLSKCITPNGLIYLTVNSPSHPAWRIRNAFTELGTSPSDYSDSSDQRQQLGMMVALMGSNNAIIGLENASKAYLNIDIFPPIAHHLSIDEWCKHGQDANLVFCGSTEALDALTMLSDDQLKPFYKMGKAALSKWFIRLRERPGMQLLFSRNKPQEPRFDVQEELWKWKPRLASCLGTLPTIKDLWSQPMHITLRFQGLPDFIIYSSAYDLEVLRRCDGNHSIKTIINDIPEKGDLEALQACLFRAYHYGLLSD